MNRSITPRKGTHRAFFAAGVATFLLLTLWTMASANSTPLSVTGWLDYSYNPANDTAIVNFPTGEKPESKLWWNDGYWWGSLFSPSANAFHIYRLNWGTQTWEDTGVPLDTRPNTKADTLWDQANNTLYVASHISVDIGDAVNSTGSSVGRLFKFTYNPTTQTYAPVAGFPKNVNADKTEILVLAQELSNANRLWVTYVSRTSSGATSRVYVNQSTNGGVTWGTPIDLSSIGTITTTAVVTPGDISAIVAFSDTSGSKVGVMWSDPTNGATNTTARLHFAWHKDGDPTNTWTLDPAITLPNAADDHINLRSLRSAKGVVFAGIKMNTPASCTGNTTTCALTGLVTRDIDGTYSFHRYSNKADDDTRPIVVVDQGDVANAADDKVYLFISGKQGGSKTCYKSLPIKFPLSTMGDFLQTTSNGNCGTTFMEDLVYKRIDNSTSTKQNVNNTTGIVVAASDNVNGHVYVHNVLGDPPPVVTAFGPALNATNVSISALISATFSKPMDVATFNTTNFIVADSSNVPVPGIFSYNSANHTVSFSPNPPLKASTAYTVKLTKGIQDTSNQPLFQRAAFAAEPTVREQWSFTTTQTDVHFKETNYSVNENAGTATITVTLSTASQQAVTVNYATSDGTGVAGVDYTAVNSTLTFPVGVTTTTFTVPVLIDTVNPGNKTVNLTLSAPVNAGLGAPTTALLTIIDQDGNPSLQFAPMSYSVNENVTSVTGSTAIINVVLNHAAASPIQVDYATSNGTATAGSDYTAATGTLTFNAGETSKSFPVSILPDNTFESNETVLLTLSNPNPGPPAVTLSSPGYTATLTIKNDDPGALVQFSSTTYSDSEGASALITVTLSNPSALPITVDYATTSNGSTAQAPSDYTPVNGTLTFNPGETSHTFTVPLLSDLLAESDEQVNLTLSNPINAAFGSAGNSALLTIVDASPLPTVAFSAPTYSVNENTGTHVATILVTLNISSAQSIDVNWATTAGGSATDGSDYVATSGILTIDPGLTSGTFDVPIIDDNVAEGNETVNLALTNPTNANLGATTNAVLTIVDDDSTPKVQFSAANYSVAENGGLATITVTLNAPYAQPVTVNYATGGGTATAGTDYTAATGMLTFAPGVTSQTFKVNITDDTALDPNETVNLTLSGPTNATLGGQATAVLTIVDNDVPTVQFSSSSYSVAENGGQATITVTLSTPIAQPVTVNYTTDIGGSATAGTDYAAAAGTLNFAANVTSQSFKVTITDDTAVESNETVNLKLSGPTNATLGQATAVLTIVDNDVTATGSNVYLPLVRK